MTRTSLGALVLLLLLVGLAAATTLRRLSLEEVTQQSREIVVGTVRETRCVGDREGSGIINMASPGVLSGSEQPLADSTIGATERIATETEKGAER